MLHMIELRPDLEALLRYISDQGFCIQDDDLGYGIHAWMAAAFGDMAPKPWRLFGGRRRPPRILGYSCHDAQALRTMLEEFADPSVFVVTSEPSHMINSRPMPAFNSGRRLGFELLVSPVGRKASTGVEKDLFLIAADSGENENLNRETVYLDWVRERMERGSACTVTKIEMSGFRLVRTTRQTQKKNGKRIRPNLRRPHVLVAGQLMIYQPDAFNLLLSQGVGRHRSFGYGMLLLKPVS
jgi:CRISPR system Cascade subunit CasE